LTGKDQAGWNGRKHFLDVGDGRRLAYVDNDGEGAPLFLVHGYTDTSRSWSLVEPWLAGRRLIMPDLAGHGFSTVARPPSLEGFADDLVRLADGLGIGRFAIAGHSMGAMTALVLAARHAGRVSAVACLSGTLRPELDRNGALAAEIMALADPVDPKGAFLAEWHRCCLPVDAGFAHHVAREAAAMPAAVWRDLLCMLGTVDLAPAVAMVHCPVQLIAGEEDALFDETHRIALRQGFPQADMHLFSGHSHNPHWESPEAVACLLNRFLAGEGV
jgi:pimeloyl-ACP methyl ester carboxylesterase